MIKRVIRKAKKAALQKVPNTYLANYLIMAAKFKSVNGRMPRKPGSVGESLNDFLFDRMIRNNWSDLQIRAVDKDLAKAEAVELCPDVRTPRTVAVIEISKAANYSNLIAQLTPFIGKKLVAKPTHGSGSVVFMDEPDAIQHLDALVYNARKNFFAEKRETQYAHLAKKIIIEENVSLTGAAPTDFKFFCFGGVPEFCQIDVGRFEHHHRAIFDVRTQTESRIRIGPFPRATDVELPPNFEQMALVAQKLAQPFDVVRVDLYSIGEDIFFSEFTFTPHAALMKVENDESVIEMIRRVRNDVSAIPLPGGFARAVDDVHSRATASAA